MTNYQQAQVITRHTNRAEISLADQHILTCHVPKRFADVVVGDEVEVSVDAEQAQIEKILPRKSMMVRPQEKGDAKALAANIDQLLIVVAKEPAGCEKLLDRYLVVAEQQDLHAVIIFNKVDLLSKNEKKQCETWLATYRQLSYPVLMVSATTREGMPKLAAQLNHKLSIFAGQSGVGKSSLINDLLPEADQRVSALSADSRLGRHTTTASHLYPLECGGAVIDSPGVREFGLYQLTRETIRSGFIEFNAYAPKCKFRDCWHTQEPECAVLDALKQGQISSARWDNYRKLLDEAL